MSAQHANGTRWTACRSIRRVCICVRASLFHLPRQSNRNVAKSHPSLSAISASSAIRVANGFSMLMFLCWYSPLNEGIPGVHHTHTQSKPGRWPGIRIHAAHHNNSTHTRLNETRFRRCAIGTQQDTPASGTGVRFALTMEKHNNLSPPAVRGRFACATRCTRSTIGRCP